MIGTTTFATVHDDHALLFTGAAPISVYPLIQEKLPYDPARDVLPVSIAVETFGAISVPASLPIKSLSDLIGFARSRPGQLNWATGGGAFPILMAGFTSRPSSACLTYRTATRISLFRTSRKAEYRCLQRQ